jgi:hypothetical protein
MLRGLIGSGAIVLVIVGLTLVAPDAHLEQASLSCSVTIDGVFSDMDACTVSPQFKSGQCACIRTPNPWLPYYFFAAVPLVILLVGALLLRGKLAVRLAFLNAGIVLGVLCTFALMAFQDAEAGMALPLLPAVIGGFCVGISSLFFVVDAALRRIRPHAT